ncbi:MAG TPA: hypothetical protein VH591_13335 [Ktedonobacterales bacterium]
MSQNYPGGDPAYPGDPNNPQTFPQQPQQAQPPGYGQEQQPPPYQPPVYNQAAQPQYPQQQPPQYPQQPKKSRRGWIIGCSIVAVVVVLICGGIGVALVIGAQTAGNVLQTKAQQLAATGIATAFCGDYVTTSYTDAYQLLSKAEQARVGTPDQFATHAGTLDTSDGQVTGCEPDTNNPLATINGNNATVKFTVQRSNKTGTATGTIKLVHEDNTWKVDGADSSLTLL